LFSFETFHKLLSNPQPLCEKKLPKAFSGNELSSPDVFSGLNVFSDTHTNYLGRQIARHHFHTIPIQSGYRGPVEDLAAAEDTLWLISSSSRSCLSQLWRKASDTAWAKSGFHGGCGMWMKSATNVRIEWPL